MMMLPAMNRLYLFVWVCNGGIEEDWTARGKLMKLFAGINF